jgi:hypothetical protein
VFKVEKWGVSCFLLLQNSLGDFFYISTLLVDSQEFPVHLYVMFLEDLLDFVSDTLSE